MSLLLQLQEEQIPLRLKREAIHLLNLCHRAKEDVEIIPLEMKSLFVTYIELHQKLSSCLQHVSCDHRREIGQRAMLTKHISAVAVKLRDMKEAFQNYSMTIQTLDTPVVLHLCKSAQNAGDNVDNMEKLKIEEIQDCYEMDDEAWDIDTIEDDVTLASDHEEEC